MNQSPNNCTRSIIIHSLEHAKIALASAAAAGLSVTLISARGAVAYAGAGWFKAMIQQATEAYPAVSVEAVLDCGDHPGYVLGALRAGIQRVRFHGPQEIAERLSAIACQNGARLDVMTGPALDLCEWADPLLACHRWLAGDDSVTE